MQSKILQSIKTASGLNETNMALLFLECCFAFPSGFFLSVIVPAQYGFYPAVCSQCGDFGSNLATICMFNTQHSTKYCMEIKYSDTHNKYPGNVIHHKASYIVKHAVYNSWNTTGQVNHTHISLYKNIWKFLKHDILVQTEGTETQASNPATAGTSHFTYGMCIYLFYR